MRSEKKRALEHYTREFEQARKEREVESKTIYGHMNNWGSPIDPGTLPKEWVDPLPLTIRKSAGGYVVEAHFSNLDDALNFQLDHFKGVK
jgi:hypothetical protein